MCAEVIRLYQSITIYPCDQETGLCSFKQCVIVTRYKFGLACIGRSLDLLDCAMSLNQRLKRGEVVAMSQIKKKQDMCCPYLP